MLTDMSNMTLQEIADSLSRFIPDDVKQFDRLETRLFTIQLSDETITKGCDIEHEEIPEIQNDINLRYMPC
jgi:hypothetical protein